MHRVVIADTSCLILFSKIQLTHILHSLYSEVFITLEVAIEFGEPLPAWITILQADLKKFELFETFSLGMGETSSLALALQLNGSTIILDDDKAKKIAKLFNIEVTGSLGVLIKAKQTNLISNFSQVLNQIKATNFYVSPELERTLLKIAGEL